MPPVENPQKSKVYVVQDTHLNLAKATRFGVLVQLLPANFHASLSGDAALTSLRSGLQGFSDDDYLLLVGDPVAIGLATVVACEVNEGRLKFLKFDRELNDYFVVTADVGQEDDSF